MLYNNIKYKEVQMSIGLVDLIIIIVIALGAIVGFKNGIIKEGTKFIGFFAIVLISFLLKDTLTVALYENLPFFNFFGLIKGLDAINILFYQLNFLHVILIVVLHLYVVLYHFLLFLIMFHNH